jgi:hypothetical protein
MVTRAAAYVYWSSRPTIAANWSSQLPKSIHIERP